MSPTQPLTPALSRAVYDMSQGRRTPVLIIIPIRHLHVVDQRGDERADPLAQRLAASGWTPRGADLRTDHAWHLIAEGAELGATDGNDYIAVDAVDGAWLTRVVAAGGLYVVYNPAGTVDQVVQQHLNSPTALVAHLPLTIPSAA